MAFLVSAHPSEPKTRLTARVQQAPENTPDSPAQPAGGRQRVVQPTAPAINTAPTRLIPLTSWGQHHAWPPIGGLRHLVFFESTNGFHKVVRRVGRRVLIDEAAFFAWVDSNGGSHAEG